MLMNGVTVESTSPEVPLPSIRTHALFPILEYIYTGALSKYGLSLSNAVDVFYASRYFRRPILEMLAISYLSAQSAVSLCDGFGGDLPKYFALAVDKLSLDMDRQILTLIAESVTCVSQVVENVAGFSQEAMHIYLDMTHNDAIRLSAAEYLRLRCLFMWCAHYISFAAAEALSADLPAEQPKIHQTGDGAYASLLSACKPYRSALAAFVKPWLPKLNFYCLHSRMVAELIEPLGIIEPSYLLRIYRFHVMFAKEFDLLQWTDKVCPPHFKVHEEGAVVECSADANSFSMGLLELLLQGLQGSLNGIL